ncbi:MAG: HEAT repeat domain-containing protein [Planctomycetia bacterium]|nr:HEAT repeat domain-containing protein [Planctomycetia bacterium]
MKYLFPLLMVLVIGGCASMNQTKRIAGVPHPAERMREIRTLGENASKIPENKKEEYVQTLRTILNEETDALIRREAVLAVAHMKVASAGDAIALAMKDNDRDVRQASVSAWATYGGERAVTSLIAMLGSETDLDIRLDCIDALGSLKDPRAVAAMAAPLSENNPALQHYTVLALQKITGKSTTDPVEWLAYCQEHGGNVVATEKAVAQNLPLSRDE